MFLDLEPLFRLTKGNICSGLTVVWATFSLGNRLTFHTDEWPAWEKSKRLGEVILPECCQGPGTPHTFPQLVNNYPEILGVSRGCIPLSVWYLFIILNEMISKVLCHKLSCLTQYDPVIALTEVNMLSTYKNQIITEKWSYSKREDFRDPEFPRMHRSQTTWKIIFNYYANVFKFHYSFSYALGKSKPSIPNLWVHEFCCLL